MNFELKSNTVTIAHFQMPNSSAQRLQGIQINVALSLTARGTG